MLRTVKLLHNYGGHKAGALLDAEAEDAEYLISQGQARTPRDTDYDGSNTLDAEQTREIIEAVKAEIGTGSNRKRLPFPMSPEGNYAAEGFGAIEPRKFWTSGSNSVSSDFTSVAEYLKAIIGATKGQWSTKWTTKDLAGDNEATGGFLIPSQLANFIWMEALEDNPFMSQATLLPMQHRTITVPYIYDVNRSTSGMHGIDVPKSIAEGAALTDISPSLGEAELNLKKIGGRVRVSSEQLEDSPQAVNVWLPKVLTDALSWQMYNQFLNGTGGGECLGILNAPATISITKETGQAPDTIVYPNICKMWARLSPAGRKTAIWMANTNTEVQLRNMSVHVGTAGSHVFALNTEGAVDRIFGKRVYFTEFCPTLGDAGDIIVFNPRAYAIGKKPNSTIRIEASEHARWENDQTVWRALARLDGQPLQSATLTPHTGSTMSHFVKIAARA